MSHKAYSNFFTESLLKPFMDTVTGNSAVGNFTVGNFPVVSFAVGKVAVQKFCNFAVKWVHRTEVPPYGNFFVCLFELQLIRCLY